MDTNRATAALAALAQESRLSAFRLLVRSGAAGLPAGDVAQALGIPHNTLSTHLGILSRAGLLQARREGRNVIYRVDFDGTRALLGFLLEDCCQGAPELCDLALDSLLVGCCESDPQKERP
ncbi:MAG: helix-turn-helix transcriptional regulator [Pseudomonadales bacterium]